MPPVTLQNRDRIRTTSFYAAFALVTYLLYIVTKPFIVPLCAAAILVVFFYPAHARLERRYGPGPAAFLSTLLVTAMLIVPVLLVLSAFVREAGGCGEQRAGGGRRGRVRARGALVGMAAAARAR